MTRLLPCLHMPAPLDVNREAVRVLATAVGVREAARQMGLAETTVKQWSRREGWFKEVVTERGVTRPHLPPTIQRQAVSGVSSPSVAMASAMADLNCKSRMSIAVTGDKLASKFESMDPDELITVTPAIKDTVTILDKTHGWSKADQAPALVNITIGPAQEQQAPVIDIQADRL